MTALLPTALDVCARPWRGMRRLAVAAGIVVAIATVGLLALSGWFITAAAIAGGTGPLAARAFNYLVPSALIRLFAILRTAARYFERLLSHRASLSTLASVRTRLFVKAAAGQARGTLHLSGGEAATLLVADIDQLEDRLIRGPALAGAVTAGLFAVALSNLVGPVTAGAVALCFGLAVWGTRALARRLLPSRARIAAEALGELKVALTEHAAGAAEIAVYGLTGGVSAELERMAGRHDEAVARLARAEAAVAMLIPAAAGTASAITLMTSSHGAAVGAMAALAVVAAGEALAGFGRAEIGAPRVDEALDRLRGLAAIVEEKPVGSLAPARTLAIRTDLETHRFAGGARVALTGRSGAGKSRILETLAGLRGDAPQQLLVDGQDAASLGLYRLRQTFALVPQDPMLLAGTVQDNLRIARPGIGEPELWQALAVACLDEEIRALPDGLGQWIGDAGLRLSGGQRKRLALARGLLAQRSWLLLDEPSEGLDGKTETRLASALRLWLDQTSSGLVLVTHRPALLGLCDQTVSLDGPRRSILAE